MLPVFNPQFQELLLFASPLVAGLHLFGPNVLFNEIFFRWLFSDYLGSSMG